MKAMGLGKVANGGGNYHFWRGWETGAARRQAEKCLEADSQERLHVGMGDGLEPGVRRRRWEAGRRPVSDGAESLRYRFEEVKGTLRGLSGEGCLMVV